MALVHFVFVYKCLKDLGNFKRFYRAWYPWRPCYFGRDNNTLKHLTCTVTHKKEYCLIISLHKNFVCISMISIAAVNSWRKSNVSILVYLLVYLLFYLLIYLLVSLLVFLLVSLLVSLLVFHLVFSNSQ